VGILLLLGAASSATAGSKPTHELIWVSGGLASVAWTTSNAVQLDGRSVFVAAGTLEVWARSLGTDPLEIVAHGRGAEVVLCDPAPLRGIVDSPSIPKLAALRVTNSASEPMHLAKHVYLTKWESQLNLTDEGETLTRAASDAQHRPHSAMLSPCAPSAASWADVLHGPPNGLVPLLRTQAFSDSISRLVSYVLVVPNRGAKAGVAEILIHANDGSPLKIPISYSVQEDLVEKSIPGAVSILLGAIAAYCAFLLQQLYVRSREERDRFASSKIEHSQRLGTFFGSDAYTAIKARVESASDPSSEIRNAQDLRRLVISDDVYSLLSKRRVRHVDRLCDSRATLWRFARRDARLLRVLKSQFAEFSP
jgi:hypothetical protein